MTKKLFYDDSYISEATCEVTQIIEKDGKYEIVLDKTPFFPEGGGQPCDLGFIDNIRVLYVHEEADTIYHVMAQKPENRIVKCIVDMNRRYDNTQQHSGEHLLSAAFFKLYNGVNAGFHMGEEYVTIDIDIKDISEEMLKAAEEEANKYIFMNVPVNTYFMQKEDALKLPLRKAIKPEGNIRIVQMGDVDYSACCGTQVKMTGEVCIIKIIKAEKYKGMTRIYFKCGNRAFKDYVRKNDMINELARDFSVEYDEILSKVKNQTEEILNMKKLISSLNVQIAKNEADNLIKHSESQVIESQYEDKNIDYIQNVYECLKDKDYILILSSLCDKKLIYGYTGNLNIDCGKIFKENIKKFDGRGGGNKNRAQAAFQSEENMKNFIDFLRSNLLK